MKTRKHMGLVVGGGAAFILMLVTLFLLYRFYNAYDRVSKDLLTTMSQLRSLQGSAPYPSRENAALVRTNLVIFQDYFDGLFKFLRRGQIEPAGTEAAKFTPLLRDSILRISKSAQAAGVILPATFAMGMERYKRGDLPSGADVPRLVVQLNTLEALCGLLIDAKVSEIVFVKRGFFEKGAESQETPGGDLDRWRSGRGVPPPEASPAQSTQSGTVDSSGLFSTEHYTFELHCHEGSVWDILNALARSQLFAVVTSVMVVNDNPVPKIAAILPAQTSPDISHASGAPVPATAAAAEQKPEIKTQEERVVAGREIVKVVLDVDVYRFLRGEKQEAIL
jgi:hypothetical protein